MARSNRAASTRTGPLPADTLFHAAARQSYDAVLAMYHDQALIPFKTLSFEDGVNVTLGLPFIRTSPDHGTAFALGRNGPRRSYELHRGSEARQRDARGAAGSGAGSQAMSGADPIASLPPLREAIKEPALSARKSLGQNFLLDLNITRRIARAAGPLEAPRCLRLARARAV